MYMIIRLPIRGTHIYFLHVHTKFYLHSTLILYTNSQQDGIRQLQTDSVRFRVEIGVSISKC